MFTGIIEEIGEIVAIEPMGDSLRLTVRGPLATSDAKRGDSICVSGVCLTALEVADGNFTADVMGQTVQVAAIVRLQPGSAVNLERAASVGDRLGGHIVQGHVDATARIIDVREHDAWRVIRFTLAAHIAHLIVDKGSVTLDGVSLTISSIGADARGHWAEVSLIPETLIATTLGERRVGDDINLETDIVARHVERLLAFAGSGSLPSSLTAGFSHPNGASA